MKTLFNVLSIIIKIATIVMAIIGAIMSIYMLILGEVYVNNVYCVVDETEDLDPDDEDQDHQLTTEAVSRTLADPRLKSSKFINVVSRSVNRIASFVANL